MITIIQLFGLALVLAGATILVKPELVFGPLRKNYDKVSLHVLAVGMRLAIGILLILCAGESRFPLAVEWLGWLSIAAAIILAVIGRRRFLALMSWAFSLLKPYGRFGGAVALTFGGFLVYAFT